MLKTKPFKAREHLSRRQIFMVLALAYVEIAARWSLAWTLYALGHAVSVVMRIADWLGFLYPVYNRLMTWSSNVQGVGPHGPWGVIEGVGD